MSLYIKNGNELFPVFHILHGLNFTLIYARDINAMPITLLINYKSRLHHCRIGAVPCLPTAIDASGCQVD